MNRLITAAKFNREYLGKPCLELDQCRLLKTPYTGVFKGSVIATTSALIQQFVKRRKIGRVFSGRVAIHLKWNPDTIRSGNVIFISYDRLPRNQILHEEPLKTPPELVIEVRSQAERFKTTREKIELFLTAGVAVVMLVDLESKSIVVYRDEEFPFRFYKSDTVTIPDVLPGFSAKVKAFFE